MSATTYGWLVLAFPLAGTVIISLGWRVLPGRLPGWIALVGDLPRLPVLDRRADQAAGPPGGGAPPRRQPLDLRLHGGLPRGHGDPDRPAVGVHVPRRERRVVPDPRLLGRLHDERPRLRALFRLPELLRLLDAAAGPGGELRDPDHRVGVRRRGLVSPDLVLVPAHDRSRGRHQGLRHQRDRRRGARDRGVPDPRQDGLARLPSGLRPGGPRRSPATTARSSLPASCCWSAPSPSPRSCRSTPGSRTPWRAPPRSPR